MTAPGDGSRRSRRLRDEERALWKTITSSVAPLKPRPREPRVAKPVAVEPPTEPSPPKAPATRPKAKARMPAPPPLAPLERRTRQRLARGKVAIDRRVDLHGLTQREAHHALAQFLHAAQAEDARIVLVITGKGARTAGSDPFAARGVLRRLVPEWLTGFRDVVVGFETANVGHGGEGALYVRLRRRRGLTE